MRYFKHQNADGKIAVTTSPSEEDFRRHMERLNKAGYGITSYVEITRDQIPPDEPGPNGGGPSELEALRADGIGLAEAEGADMRIVA